MWTNFEVSFPITSEHDGFLCVRQHGWEAGVSRVQVFDEPNMNTFRKVLTSHCPCPTNPNVGYHQIHSTILWLYFFQHWTSLSKVLFTYATGKLLLSVNAKEFGHIWGAHICSRLMCDTFDFLSMFKLLTHGWFAAMEQVRARARAMEMNQITFNKLIS